MVASWRHATNGIAWWLLTRAFRSVALYDGISGEIFRSFAPPGSRVTRWSHLGAAPSDFVHWRIWTDVCRSRSSGGRREGDPVWHAGKIHADGRIRRRRRSASPST
jgi:hypothetical protein